MDLFFIATTLAKIVFFTFLLVLTLVAYSVYAERRFSAIIQDRVGPNRTGIPLTILGFKKDLQLPLGALTQPLADGLKFILKEDFTPSHVRKGFFWIAPALTMVPALVTVAVIPFGSDLTFGDKVVPMVIADIDVGPLFIFAIASLSVYGITLAGWASNNKYSFLGGVRSSAQMISYEISLGLSVVPVLLIFGDLNLSNIVQSQAANGWAVLPLWNEGGFIFTPSYFENGGWQQLALWVPMVIAFIIFTISIFAETNRTPFDLAECETELVGGYHTEYSSMKFALFFLGEYAAMIVGSSLIVTLFLGGWSIGFGLDALLPENTWWVGFVHLGCFLTKVVAFVLFFILVRWSIPRFRYDQLMNLGWIVFFEAALINVFVTALIIAFPNQKAPVAIGFAVLAAITIALILAIKKNPAKTISPSV